MSGQEIPSYSIEDHQHRLAAWSASRAASASKLCRFSVKQGVWILEKSGFNAALAKPEQLPEPKFIDEKHLEWREDVIKAAQSLDVPFLHRQAASKQLPLSHGVAAKLINTYLKARFVCGGYHQHPNVEALHPPVDRLLLNQLAKENVAGLKHEWLMHKNKAWSKFTSDDYQAVINHFRQAMPGRPLWEIEQYWQGYQ